VKLDTLQFEFGKKISTLLPIIYSMISVKGASKGQKVPRFIGRSIFALLAIPN
jgi:hypothetical protein